MITALKLGGSVITDKSKPYTARGDEMERLAKEIGDALADDSNLNLVIGNGGGSFPHQPAEKGQLKEGITDAWQLEHFVETQRAASELNHLLVTLLVNKGVPAFSIKPSSAAYTQDGEIKDFNLKAIEELLKLKAVPVLHGDILLDLNKGCSIISTEKLFGYLAGKLPVDRIIIGTNVDGVLDDKNQVIGEINNSNFDSIKHHLKGSETTDVTGGMQHKVESMLSLTGNVTEILIVNALKGGNVKRALAGERLGTRITND